MHIELQSLDKIFMFVNICYVSSLEKIDLIDEVKNVVSKYDHFPTAMQGLGYKEVVEYLDGKISKEEMIDKIKQETRRYAKRQLTWFRKNKEIIWIDGLDKREKNIDIIIDNIKN